MSRLDGLRHRLTVLIKGDAYAEETQRELCFHRDLDALSKKESTLGNETYYREEVRRMTLITWVDRIRQNVRYALRGLQRSPGFTAAVVLTLGLGVGVNGAMFSLLSRVFLEPPAGVVRPDEVRRFYVSSAGRRDPWGRIVSPRIQYPQYTAWRALVDASFPLGIVSPPESTSVRDDHVRVPVRVSYANAEYFSVLGIRAEVGRLFAADEGAVERRAPVVVISDELWHRAFQGSGGAIGRQMKIRNDVVTVVGVAMPGFRGIEVDAADLWMPPSMYPGNGGRQGVPWYRSSGSEFIAVARPSSIAQEQELVGRGTSAIRSIRAGDVEDSTAVLISSPLIDALGPGRQSNEVIVATRLGGVSLFVLLIAAANIANLLLLRSARRGREIAVRRAIGASRARLFEQIASEAFVLAAGGAGVALLFATWATRTLQVLVFPSVHWAAGPITWRAAAFILVTSAGITLVAGFAPALQAMKPHLTSALKSGARDGYRNSKLRDWLLTLQTALSIVLLVGAGLFLRSLSNLSSIDLGYDTSDRVFLGTMFDAPVQHASEVRGAVPLLTERLRTRDGVLSVAFMSHGPIVGMSFGGLYLPGRDALPHLPGEFGPSYTSVSPDYFRATGMRLIAGREFNTSDAKDAPGVVVVSETMARLYWPGETALGKCVLTTRGGPCVEVVGVVADAHRMAVVEAPTTQYFLPIAQTGERPQEIVVHLRRGSKGAVVRAAEEIARTLVTDLVALSVRDFDRVTEPQLRPWRTGATLFTALGVLALIVAAVGVYSVVAYSVSQRTHEMGVRIALGAGRSRILDLIVGSGLRVVLVGVATGLIASLALGRLVASLLFGIEPNDPSVLITASLVLVVVSVLACLVPAWRASGVNPVDALRAD